MGVLSRLFGEKAGANALRLEDPIDAEEIVGRMTDEDEDSDPDQVVALILFAIALTVCLLLMRA